jgi:capsular polysaccharide export protein
VSIRYVAISTGNTRPLIDVLGHACDAIDTSLGTAISTRFPAKAPSADMRAHAVELDAIAERNVTRRRIRFPGLFGNPAVVGLYRAYYRAQVRLLFRHIQSELARDTERTVLVFNGYLAPNALLALAARSLSMPRLFLENGFYPGTMQCDRTGINALSTLPRDAGFYDRLSDDDCGEGWPDAFVTRKSKLKDGNAPTSVPGLPDNYIFVPFQVPSDMQILALSPWIGDMMQLHAEIAALANAFPDRSFVIKEHPSFPISIQDRVARHPRIIFANSATTSDLIEDADAVITVNSTVGLESLTLGRKVITLGEAHYNIEGLVLNAPGREALHEAFSGIDGWTPDETRRQRFIRFVNNRYLIPVSREKPGAEAPAFVDARAQGTDIYSRLILQ